MKLVPSMIPTVGHVRENAWNRTITDEMTRALRRHPNVTFQLIDGAAPVEMTAADVAALRAAAPNHFRVRTRAISNSELFHVWIFFDPSRLEKGEGDAL